MNQLADTSIVVEFKSPEDKSTDPIVDPNAPEYNIRLEQGEELIDVTAGYSPCVNKHLKTDILAFPSPGDLEYNLKPMVDHAVFLPGVEVIEDTKTESISVRLSNEVDLSRKGITRLISANWSGSVYDAEGNIVSDPPTYGDAEGGGGPMPLGSVSSESGMVYEDGVLAWSQELVGTLNISYERTYFRHIISVEPKPDENPYKPESYEIDVAAFYNGKAETLSLSFSFDCESDDDDDDEEEPSPEPCYKRVIEYDPCTGDPTGREWTEPMPCPGDEEAT